MDDFRDLFVEFLSSKSHRHAPEEVMAALDILRDELNELEPEDRALTTKAKEKIQKCKICASSLQNFTLLNTPHTEPALS